LTTKESPKVFFLDHPVFTIPVGKIAKKKQSVGGYFCQYGTVF